MWLCIPTRDANGAAAIVDAHFGRAHTFTFVDTETGEIRTVENGFDGARGGAAVTSMLGRPIDAVACRELGDGARRRLRTEGIKIYRVPGRWTVSAVVEALSSGGLEEIEAPQQGGVAGCGHHHGRHHRYQRPSGFGCGHAHAHRHGRSHHADPE